MTVYSKVNNKNMIPKKVKTRLFITETRIVKVYFMKWFFGALLR